MKLVDQEAVRLIALDNVTTEPERQSAEYHLRRVFRWYSKTFHTPLHEVEGLPLHDILQHYYEVHYEEMEEPDRDAERDELVMTPKERRAARRQRDARRLEDYEFEREAEADRVLKFKKGDGPKKGSLGALEAAGKKRDTSHLDRPTPGEAAAAGDMMMVQAQAEDIHMEFAGVEELAALENADALDLNHDDPLVGED